MRIVSQILTVLVCVTLACDAASGVEQLSVLSWNTQHYGWEQLKPEKQAMLESNMFEVVRAVNPDIFLMQETYGSFERFKAALPEYDARLLGRCNSIFSRFPITGTHEPYREKNNYGEPEGGAFNTQVADLDAGGMRLRACPVAMFWLPLTVYTPTDKTPDELIAWEGAKQSYDAAPRPQAMAGILEGMAPFLAERDEVPILMAGDFNSNSHLDWTESSGGWHGHNGRVVAWPVSSQMVAAGFQDVFRVLYPDPGANYGATFPVPGALADLPNPVVRLDYIYTAGKRLTPVSFEIIAGDYHSPFVWQGHSFSAFPSDHAAVLARFAVETQGQKLNRLVASAPLPAAVPNVTGVTMTQANDRLVTIGYTLSDAPAVITLDVQTNYTESGETKWASIGGTAVCNATGDVWKRIGESLTEGNSTAGTITWLPDLSWPDRKITDGGARAVVTAWPLDNTPDYMVVDLTQTAATNSQCYYPSADYLPGGILGNPDYRTTSIVMRKIMAKGVRWTMGSTSQENRGPYASRETTHQVSLTNNYYIGVFEVTQSQWALVQTRSDAVWYPSYFTNLTDRAMRPVEQVCYNEIRESAGAGGNSNYRWPADPNPASFLGMLRTKTGIDFDLPGEAQWEFAARAGNGVTKWGDGSGIQNTETDTNLARLGRYQRNGGQIWNGSAYADPDRSCGATNGTAIVGSYAPNAWGLYDTAGNVYEWCLDWYRDDISGLDGMVNVSEATYRSLRSGCLTATAIQCRPAFRTMSTIDASGRGKHVGLRLACTAGLR